MLILISSSYDHTCAGKLVDLFCFVLLAKIIKDSSEYSYDQNITTLSKVEIFLTITVSLFWLIVIFIQLI